MREEFDLKPISREAIPRAMQKAERYRLLNEPQAAESICRDILEIDPGNQEVLVMLILALTDGMRDGLGHAERATREVLQRISDPYQKAYYTGVTAERHGLELLRSRAMGSSSMAYESFREAMRWYEKAEALRPAGDDDPILRWNTCVRILEANGALQPRHETGYVPALED